ncbi:DUF4132 domain-containing protein [Altererythrobacter xixiisoli]|uniref:DUF4132 domain-containing protein n=1 Tax=Croceibacterium xixiisoli TaxID=1476466 RepID=A0A6I4TXY1_9SPHN|nr:DUF4132 domain-containing protein [Croceibacterium xixiisoli]MXP00855.1 DUF4132 domain-containing protein [Croceibacterium xixiisoli]
MSLGIWDKVKQGLGIEKAGEGDTAGGVASAKLRAFFGHLAKAGGNLPAETAEFIRTGENPSLLLTVAGTAVQQQWNSRHRSYPRKDKAGLFKDVGLWQPGQLKRYGEVLAALEPITYDWGYYGTKKSPDWLRHAVTNWLGDDRKDQPLGLLHAVSEAGGAGLPAVLDVLFCRDAASYGTNTSVGRFSGVAELLEEQRDEVVAIQGGLAADVRAELVSTIGRLGLHRHYLPLLLDSAVGSSKKVRTAARQALTGADKADLQALIEERLTSAAPGQRAELVDVIAGTLDAAAPALLEKIREGETSAKVLAALDRSTGATTSAIAVDENRQPDGEEGFTAVDGSWIAAPPTEPIPQSTPIGPEVMAVLKPAMEEFNRIYREARQSDAAKQKWHWTKHSAEVSAGDLEKLRKLAEGSGSAQHQRKPLAWMTSSLLRHPAVEAFLDHPDITLYHLMRLSVASSNSNFISLFSEWSGPVGAAVQRRVAKGADLRTIAALWLEHGGSDFLHEHLTRNWYWALPELEAPLWPYVLQRIELLDEALGLVPQSGQNAMRAMIGLDLLAGMPALPERYRPRLMILANDSSSRVRDAARNLLRDTPGIGGSIALQLEDGRQDTRALAADWLARRGDRDQAPAIRQALKKDKSDVARAAMISALERMGEDVSEYFDHAAMVKEAKAGIAKAKTKGLEWFPFDQLPALKWADGSDVDPVLPRWWVLLAVKLKQPGGNALMELWLDRLAPGDAHRLGWMVLTGWIDEDTRTPTDEEANAFAMAHVDTRLQQNIDYAKRWPQSADYWPTDRGIVFARLKSDHAGIYLSSTADSKGMLALTTHVNGADAAQRVRAYLKDHGGRVSQAKALLEALAANSSSAALQVVLVASNRTKQKSVQALAGSLIEAIADRNGWTAALLADRTIPHGGFEADGTLDLECGDNRRYTARLDESDAVVLFNADGKEVKSLPGPRVDEEKPAVDAAKKALSNARKEVKQVITAQAERLQEAMCLQRHWLREDWESFILGHPIVGRLATRLVWQGLDADGNEGETFRPMGDGSFTDRDDGDVDIAGFAEIRLAHSSLLDADVIAAWRQHLTDYAIKPPFDQFGRELPELTKQMVSARDIMDREGWMIETFKLRGTAGKLGYQRGPAQDGGWFLTYEKTYRDAGLIVEIEFTGSPLPEENRPAALQSLGFRKLKGQGVGGSYGGKVALGDVPPVLLAECWRDLHDIADKGTGFDAEWNKKAYV